MRLHTLAATTAIALVASLAPTVAADAAAKPVFKVSISTSKTKADVGQTIKVSGKVAGPKAAKKRLAVQVKVGNGRWKTVKKVRATKKRRYSTSVKVTTAGQQYVRVVAPKSTKARIGVSKSRGFVGWRWLDLTSQPKYTRGSVTVAPATIAGTSYDKAITLTEGARVAFNVNGACDTYKSAAGIKDGIGENATLTTFVSTPGWGNGYPAELTANAAATPQRQSLDGIYTLGMDAEAGTATVASPTVHCTVNRLASAASLFQ
ncbi:hypothetical protein [Aeromicrobium sp.]|uniref:hypothetical protein n=1 Tax=Aeromicrobium sp. TaxID=1871063 RepID=UPI0028AD447F|nr:hypothetical protein [Aeromicrobium sp.]